MQELDSIQRILGKKNKTGLIDWSISLLRNYQTFYDGAKVLRGGFKNGLGYKYLKQISEVDKKEIRNIILSQNIIHWNAFDLIRLIKTSDEDKELYD